MARYRHKRNGDVITTPKALEHKYDAHPQWERVKEAGQQKPADTTKGEEQNR